MSRQYLLLLPLVLSSVVVAAHTQVAEPAPAPAEAQPQANGAKQCTVKIWVGREAEFEELLKTAEVISMKDIGVGVTKPLAVMLKKGDQEFKAAFKPIKRGRAGGDRKSVV